MLQQEKYRANKRKLEQSVRFQKFLRSKYYIKDGELYIRPSREHKDRIVRGATSGGTRYLKVTIVYNEKGISFYKHRLMFFLYNGYFANIVDHINRDVQDNSKENLREVFGNMNQLNCYQSQKARGLLPYIGVGICSDNKNKFRAYIKVLSVFYHLGVYDTPEEAAQARDDYIKEHNLLDRYKLNFGE